MLSYDILRIIEWAERKSLRIIVFIFYILHVKNFKKWTIFFFSLTLSVNDARFDNTLNASYIWKRCYKIGQK